MQEVQLRQVDNGVVLGIRAQPGSRRQGIIGVHDGALKIAVTAKAEGGKANEAIVALIAKAFRLPKSHVQLLSGAQSRHKRVLLIDAQDSQIQVQLTSLLAER
ncbi:MAG: UPF0235 protein [Pirellulaceae bacterium]|nr:MAG: UPF0235 protein [Pirellulaceae bacterium]